MYYINAISSVSHQNSFNHHGFSNDLPVLEKGSELIAPDYKKYINPKLIRRMSKVIRMSVACSYNCLENAQLEGIDGIVTGTGLGCLTDTQKFLEHFLTTEGLMSPTSFIQSTHNTIAGQISLLLGNHGYNITHTQNNVSFEKALEDAMMCLEDGMQNVLIGAADEYISFLEEIKTITHLNLTSGATFLVLSKERTATTIAEVKAVKVITNSTSLNEQTELLLKANNTSLEEIDTLWYSNPFNEPQQACKLNAKSVKSINNYTGIYPTNAALAFHMGVDQIAEKKAQQILVCNHLTKRNLGFTLIKAV